MDSIPLISFKFFGKYGHFRKPYSNVSSLSYPFPPRTAIAGLLGAILGIPKGEIAERFNERNLSAAIEITSAIKTTTHVTNFRQDSSGGIDYSIKHTRKNAGKKELKKIPEWNMATQIPMELLRSPSYTLYINLKENMQELVSRIRSERYVYTPCMGLSEFLAELEYISFDVAKPLDIGEHEIHTVVGKEDCSLSIDKLDVKMGHQILELKAPYLGTSDRRFTYKRYLLNMLQKPLPVRMNICPYQFEDKAITFL
jgi:CRISPR-associated protein Cas5h